MNKLYDKNGSSKIKYIGVIDDKVNGSQVTWVGVIRLGDKMYVPQGAGVYHTYHAYDSETGKIDWEKDYKISEDVYKELSKQYERLK